MHVSLLLKVIALEAASAQRLFMIGTINSELAVVLKKNHVDLIIGKATKLIYLVSNYISRYFYSDLWTAVINIRIRIT